MLQESVDIALAGVAQSIPWLDIDLAHNPGMRPNWESNQQPFDSQAGTQPLSHTSQGRAS